MFCISSARQIGCKFNKASHADHHYFRHGRRIVGGLGAGDGGAEGEAAGAAGGDEGGALRHGRRVQEADEATAQRDAGTDRAFLYESRFVL